MTALSFSAGQLDSLRGLGVTPAQVECLESVLPSIAAQVATPPAAKEVEAALDELASALSRALRVIQAAGSLEATPDREAANILQLAAARAGGLTCLLAFAADIPKVAALAQQARGMVPKVQRRGMAWPSAVFEVVLNALATPGDDESRALAATAKPARGHRTTGNPFPDIVRTCYEAATCVAAPDLRALLDAWRKAPMTGALVTAARQHGHARSKS